jgi:hypothetical protein
MPDRCTFPNCRNNAVNNAYCIGHEKLMRGPQPAETKPAGKRQKPIPKKSKKRIRQDAEYKRVSAELGARTKPCQIKSPVCTGRAQGLDHKKGRVGMNLLDKTNLVPACNACNTYCSDNPAWAADNGHAVSRLAK